MDLHLSFFVPGEPKAAGSKRAFGIKKGGVYTGRFVVTDANKGAAPWKAQVRVFAEQNLPPGFQLIDAPLQVRFTFYRVRPKGHYRSNGELNKQGLETPYPIAKPDVLKLARGVEDALTGIVWQDDARIVAETLYKRWGLKPGVLVEITTKIEEMS